MRIMGMKLHESLSFILRTRIFNVATWSDWPISIFLFGMCLFITNPAIYFYAFFAYLRPIGQFNEQSIPTNA